MLHSSIQIMKSHCKRQSLIYFFSPAPLGRQCSPPPHLHTNIYNNKKTNEKGWFTKDAVV